MIELRVGRDRWHVDHERVASLLATVYRIIPSDPTGPADLVVSSGPPAPHAAEYGDDVAKVALDLDPDVPVLTVVHLADDIEPLRLQHRLWLFVNRALLDLDVAFVHGAAVTIDGRTVIICGPSGAGKTTLAAALGLRGATVHGEDWLLAHRNGADMMISGVSTLMRVTDQTRDLVLASRIDHAERSQDEKHKLVFDASTVFDADPSGLHRPDAIYLLGLDNETAVGPASGLDALRHLVEHSKMCTQLTDPSGYRCYFDIMSALASSAPAWHLRRAEGRDTIDRLIDLVREGGGDDR